MKPLLKIENLSKMKSIIVFLTVLVIVSLQVGCSVVSMGQERDSPDNTVRVTCMFLGTAGHKYTDQTKKTVGITIERIKNGDSDKESEKELTKVMFKTYRLRGSYIWWRPVWATNGDISIVLYDKGPNSTNYSFTYITNSVDERRLRTINYHLDPITKKYIETD